MTTTQDLVARARARQALPAPAMRSAIRKAAGISQADMAEALGVSQALVSRWETGALTPVGNRLVQYLEILRALSGDGVGHVA